MILTSPRRALATSVVFAALASLAACGSGVTSTDGTSMPTSSGCGSPSSTVAGCAQVPSNSTTPAAPTVCSYPTNLPGCPPTFATVPALSSCSSIGLKCGYPGSPDGGKADNCSFAAQLVCSPADGGSAGDDGGDGGVDGGAPTGVWTSSAE